MEPLSQILAGLEAAWWLIASIPAVPAATNPGDRAVQTAIGALCVLLFCGWVLFAGA